MTDLTARVIIEGVNKLSGALGGAAKSLQDTGRKMASVGRSMSLAFTAPATAAVVAAANYERAMLEWEKAADEIGTSEGYKAAYDAMNNLAMVLPQSHRELAEMATQASKAGVAFKDVEGFILLAAKAAAAFDIEAKEAGVLLSSIKEGIGLTNDEMQLMLGQMDLLENAYKTTGAHLIDYMVQEGAVGRAAGFTNEQFLAMSATMEATGISTDKVARSMRRIAMNLAVGEGATKGQAEAFKALGLNSVQVAKALQTEGGLPKVLAQIKEGLDKLPKYQRLSVISDLVESMAAAPFMNVINNLDMFNEMLDMVGEHDAAFNQLQKSFEIGMKGLWPQLYLLRNAVMSLVFVVTDAWMPIIKSVVDGLREWAEKMKEHPALLNAIAKAFGALALLGPALVITGYALQGIGTALKFISAAVASPWMLAFAAAAWVVYSAFEHWDIVGPALQDVADAWNELVGAISDTGIGEAISETTKAFAELLGMDTENWSATKATAEALVAALRTMAKTLRAIRALVEDPFDLSAWGDLVKILKPLSILANPGAAISGMFSGKAAEAAAEAGPTMWERFMEAHKKAALAAEPVGEEANNWLASMWDSFMEAHKAQMAPLLKEQEEGGGKPIEAKAKLEGRGHVQVDVKVTGPGQVTGMSATDDGGHIALDTGTSMQDTGVGQ